jgi:small subunit ribosomal protein S17
MKKISKNKLIEGVVTSDKMAKTCVVQVVRKVRHPRLDKLITKSKKYYAHDEKGEAKVGKTVRIVECRPLSKLKRFRVVEIL